MMHTANCQLGKNTDFLFWHCHVWDSPELVLSRCGWSARPSAEWAPAVCGRLLRGALCNKCAVHGPVWKFRIWQHILRWNKVLHVSLLVRGKMLLNAPWQWEYHLELISTVPEKKTPPFWIERNSRNRTREQNMERVSRFQESWTFWAFFRWVEHPLIHDVAHSLETIIPDAPDRACRSLNSALIAVAWCPSLTCRCAE